MLGRLKSVQRSRLLAIVWALAAPAALADDVRLIPGDFTLSGPAARQRLCWKRTTATTPRGRLPRGPN